MSRPECLGSITIEDSGFVSWPEYLVSLTIEDSGGVSLPECLVSVIEDSGGEKLAKVSALLQQRIPGVCPDRSV